VRGSVYVELFQCVIARHRGTWVSVRGPSVNQSISRSTSHLQSAPALQLHYITADSVGLHSVHMDPWNYKYLFIAPWHGSIYESRQRIFLRRSARQI